MEPGLRPGSSHGCPPSHNLPAMLATAWSPDEHCLLTVDKGTVSGMSLKQKARWESQPASLCPALRESKPGLLASLTAPLWGSWGRADRKTRGTNRQPCPHSRRFTLLEPISAGACAPGSHKHMPFHPVILLNQGQAWPKGKRRLAGPCLAFEGSKVKTVHPSFS